MERRGKKLLGPRAVAATSDIKGGLAAAVTLPEIGNAWPSDDSGASARGERGAGIGVGERERERSYYGPEDMTKNKWAP